MASYHSWSDDWLYKDIEFPEMDCWSLSKCASSMECWNEESTRVAYLDFVSLRCNICMSDTLTYETNASKIIRCLQSKLCINDPSINHDCKEKFQRVLSINTTIKFSIIRRPSAFGNKNLRSSMNVILTEEMWPQYPLKECGKMHCGSDNRHDITAKPPFS